MNNLDDRDSPSPNRPNGRDSRGRFVAGNPGGPGNPFAARLAKLRAAVLEAVTPDDVRRVMRKLVALAEEGDVAAARVLLDRVLGAPKAAAEAEPETPDAEAVLARIEKANRELDARIRRLDRTGEEVAWSPRVLAGGESETNGHGGNGRSA